jgi:hypothetical protein
MPQVLTANRLKDGEVVYLDAAEHWVEELSGAKLLASAAEGEAALATGVEAERDLKVVHAYLFDVIGQGEALKPVKMREIIRAAGPTIRRDLGKQARA